MSFGWVAAAVVVGSAYSAHQDASRARDQQQQAIDQQQTEADAALQQQQAALDQQKAASDAALAEQTAADKAKIDQANEALTVQQNEFTTQMTAAQKTAADQLAAQQAASSAQLQVAQQAAATQQASLQAQVAAADKLYTMQSEQINRENQKQPDTAAITAQNVQAGKSGQSGTMLTGPSGVDLSSLLLGKNTLLGS